MNEWISVHDRIPKHTQNGVHDAVKCLVVIDSLAFGKSIDVAYWMNNRFDGYPQGASDVTHWMYLPELPEE